jgi:hypothetical protein
MRITLNRAVVDLLTERTVAALNRIDNTADTIGEAAGKISKASGKIEPNARKPRRAASTWRASAFADLLGRLVGR